MRATLFGHTLEPPANLEDRRRAPITSNSPPPYWLLRKLFFFFRSIGLFESIGTKRPIAIEGERGSWKEGTKHVARESHWFFGPQQEHVALRCVALREKQNSNIGDVGVRFVVFVQTDRLSLRCERRTSRGARSFSSALLNGLQGEAIRVENRQTETEIGTTTNTEKDRDAAVVFFLFIQYTLFVCFV